jgi:EpsI family protein
MSGRTRRDALVLLVAMGGASALAMIARPAPRAPGTDGLVDLDTLFPEQFDGWRVDEAARALVRPALREGQRYGFYDQVLERTFVDASGQRVMLSVAFGGEQSASLQLHRPEVCYRASGYQVRDVRGDTLTVAGRPIPVTTLKAEMPGRFEPVTYWTLLGGEVVADSSSFRWRRLSFAARGQLLDGMLVRVSSISPDAGAAFELHLRFADSMLRAMAPAERAKVIGQPARS